MKSKRTRQLGRINTLLFLLSWTSFAVAAVLISIITIRPSTGVIDKLKGLIGPTIWSFLVSNVILIALAFLVKDKIKPIVWTVDIIMANVLFGNAAMYIVFALNMLDTYVLTPIYQTNKTRYITNQELDKRC